MERKKKIIIILLIIIIPIITILTIFTIRYFTYSKSVDDIKTIEISTYKGYLSPSNKYNIDFDKNLVTYNYTYLNQTNNDNQCSSRNFTKEDSEYFIKKANLYGFFNWKESYKAKYNGADLPSTNIYITFKDNSVQEIYCLAEFPPNYDKMAEVFHEAFGYNIL
ncbi:MAG: hypothetical protein J6B75_02950 [Ruminococcus sp.]|nr:hypothetical protein [Ruminococcus sp.]